MADWYGHARSNYFKVKDIEAFKDFVSNWGAEFISNEQLFIIKKCHRCLNKKPDVNCGNYVKMVVGECKGKTRKTILVGFLGEECNGGLPSFYEDENGNEFEFDDFTKELSGHLEDGWVAIMQEVGAEKLRYITGFAIAVNSKGESRVIHLNNIHKLAEELGSNVTRCEG